MNEYAYRVGGGSFTSYVNYHDCTSYEGHMVDLPDVNFEIFSIRTQGL